MLMKIAEILTVAKKPVLKEHIKQKCSLTTSSSDTYIKQMLESGLLDGYPAVDLKHVPGRKSSRRMIYRISVAGQEFLQRYNDLLTLLNRVERVRKFQKRRVGLSAGSLSFRLGSPHSHSTP